MTIKKARWLTTLLFLTLSRILLVERTTSTESRKNKETLLHFGKKKSRTSWWWKKKVLSGNLWKEMAVQTPKEEELWTLSLWIYFQDRSHPFPASVNFLTFE
jgi:hypothetical protein